jgi:AraC-like DNA-binding protein
VVARDEDMLSRALSNIERHFDVRRPPLHAEVRGAILRRLGMHDCSNETIADELNLHSRTLHRRLRDEGTSFQAIKDQVRKDLLLYFLRQTDLGLLDVAERLDFSEQSVMSRYCRRWFEASPSSIRRDGLRRAP